MQQLFESNKTGAARSPEKKRRASFKESFYERQAIERTMELNLEERRGRSSTVKILHRKQNAQQNGMREDREIEKLERWLTFMQQKV